MFDAVGTLIHPEPSVAVVYQQIAAAYGVTLPVQAVKERFQQVMSSRGREATTSEEAEFQFWREVVLNVIGDVAEPELCFQELYQHFARSSAWGIDPDAAQTLAALRRQGLQTAIASNFDARLNTLVEQIPGLQGFNDIFISSQIGWRKPHPEFFEVVRNRLQLPAEAILMVGDDLQLDVLPALKMGMQALHLSPVVKADHEHSAIRIDSLVDVLKWCEIDGRS